MQVADDVLRQGVRGISDIITIPGMVNVDFADVRAVMTGAGSSLMGQGSGRGEDRAVQVRKWLGFEVRFGGCNSLMGQGSGRGEDCAVQVRD
eukprot:363308-Chlamydomonas_euryale.AAC.10